MLQHNFQKIAHLQIFNLQIKIKEHLNHNAQRHTHDIFVKIAHLTTLPLVKHLLNMDDHHVNITLNILSPKNQRDKLSLPAPEVTLSNQKTTPQHIIKLVKHR